MAWQTRWAAALVLLLSFSHALEQAVRGVAGAALLAGAAALVAAGAAWRWLGPAGAQAAVALRVDADGAL